MVSPTSDYTTCRVLGNTLADSSSPQQRLAASTIGSEAFHHLMGASVIDLFANIRNLQFPDYCSWKPDPQTKVINFLVSGPYATISLPTFQFDWESTVKDLLRGGRSSVSIAPAWQAQVWYSQLLRMLVGNPILEQDLLLVVGLKPHPLTLENQMFLAAWPVSD